MKIMKCKSCNKLHLEFNNLLLNFDGLEELKDFFEYLKSIDPILFEQRNEDTIFSRKIFIPIPLSNVKMAFNKNEFLSLRGMICRYIKMSSLSNKPLNFLKEQMN